MPSIAVEHMKKSTTMISMHLKLLISILIFASTAWHNVGCETDTMQNYKEERQIDQIRIKGEAVFTALADMEALLETENVLINNLEGYIHAQEERLDYLRRRVNEYQKEHDSASDDTSYLLNPINAYLLTKRLTSDWRDIEQVMTTDVGAQFMYNISNYRNVMKFPTDEDLSGAAFALIRLQDTYGMKTEDLAGGKLNGIQFSSQMSSEDCFEIGRQTYLQADFHHTILWMKEALNRINNNSQLTRADVLEYLAFSTFKQGEVREALDMTNELLALAPNHQRARGNKQYYEKELLNLNQKALMRGDDGTDTVPHDNSLEFQHVMGSPHTYDLPERKMYELTCRGEIKPPQSILKQLFCRYVTNGIPFLKIAPLKQEQMYIDPFIVVYHDVMYDSEIEVIQELAKPRFRRATVQNQKTGELEVAHYRISKSAWLKDEDHPVISTVVRRIQDMTGLSMETAEELQVANYGIGGHYEPHYDFARKEEVNAFKNHDGGNRIATVLFYMTDVQLGGATAFTALRTALWPKKGSAAFWFNLRRSGQGDYMTRHAACPVIVGTKWVSNKWIHERGNEFIRPCALEPDHDMEF